MITTNHFVVLRLLEAVTMIIRIMEMIITVPISKAVKILSFLSGLQDNTSFFIVDNLSQT